MNRRLRWMRMLLLASGAGIVLQTASCTAEQQQAFMTSLTSALVQAILTALSSSLTAAV